MLIKAGFYLISPNAYGLEREMSLYPLQDIELIESSEKLTNFRLGLTEIILNFKPLPCLFLFNQIPLFYSVIQAGVSCGLKVSSRNNTSLTITPEISIGENPANSKFALGVGIGNTFDLTNSQRSWLAVGNFNYKFWNSESTTNSYNFTTSELLQIWGHTFNSNISLGLLYNNTKDEHSKNRYSNYFYYLQSIPLELRRIGGAENTVALTYKAVGISFRKEAFQFLIFGLGIAYWSLTLDGIRISAPIPDAYLSVDF